ncbi:hypothetical protein ACH47B_31805 [Rhodococcus sp. NPDC019627]|uniref:hypothetical protein n=1 Tax=unclassified Rhodococcus (in: high G+C Gram-positive bacteria) TaxID=192944 RepID=UPI0033FB077F
MRATPEGTSEKESVSHTGVGPGALVRRQSEDASNPATEVYTDRIDIGEAVAIGRRTWIDGQPSRTTAFPHTEDVTVDSGEGRTASVRSQVG